MYFATKAVQPDDNIKAPSRVFVIGFEDFGEIDLPRSPVGRCHVERVALKPEPFGLGKYLSDKGEDVVVARRFIDEYAFTGDLEPVIVQLFGKRAGCADVRFSIGEFRHSLTNQA